MTFTIGRGTEICAGHPLAGAVVMGRSSTRSPPTWPVLAADAAATASSAGSARRKARSTSPRRRGQRRLGPVGNGRQAAVEAAGRHDAGGDGRCIDFRYLTDALTPEEALEILRRAGRQGRAREEMRDGLPGVHDLGRLARLPRREHARLCREAWRRGGRTSSRRSAADLDDDVRRARIMREEIGWDRTLMMDANQVWDVGEAIANMKRLAEFKPWWIEEPTSPDDVLGHAAIARRCARSASASPPASTATTG